MYKDGGALAVTGITILGLPVLWAVFLSLALVLVGVTLTKLARQSQAKGKFGA